MTGGLMQLVAIGRQNYFFTRNPKITFFKAIYHKYTNFVIQPYEIFYLENTPKTKIRIKIDKIGDLLNKMVIKVNINPNNIKRVGHFIFKTIKIEIGGQIIDTHYGEWYDIWYEIYRNNDYKKMIEGDTIFLPLRFWFNNFIGLSLPLISLQYQDIYILMELNNIVQVNSLSIICDYIFLDIDQRRKFATSSHKYLIQTVETHTNYVNPGHNRIVLPFNTKIKEIYWIIQQFSDLSNYSYTICGKINPLLKGKITFNGEDRTKMMNGNYYNYAQPYAYHDNIPKDGINMYSFSLYPGEYQISGYARFPKHVELELEYMNIKPNTLIYIFAQSYSIYNISNGYSKVL